MTARWMFEMATKITEYHIKYFAHDLMCRREEGSPGRFTGALANSPQVDLNPHQVEAALFAFDSPLSKGAILADEVGLGKTIEAGILLSQFWADRKRRILILVPASLRTQWKRELAEKFFLPSVIIDGREFKKLEKSGKENPFEQDRIVICSHHFGANKAEFLCRVPWDLVVIDEAHRLRNVFKDQNIIAQTLRVALDGVRKVLLTATPLQNSLMELYGLVSFIDPLIFGDEESFRERYVKKNLPPERFQELRERLKPVCLRTLRHQVREYVNFTNRISIIQDFVPTREEQELYDRLWNYLMRPRIHAFSNKALMLMALLLMKFLASSTFAIAGTLHSLASKLENRLKAEVTNGRDEDLPDQLSEGFESSDLDSDDLTEEMAVREFQVFSVSEIRAEIEELKSMRDFAFSIQENAKGLGLCEALESGFSQVHEMKAAEKAIIFTESRRTQQYIKRVLEGTSFRGVIVLFNGTNEDRQSQEIYENWRIQHTGSEQATGNRLIDTKTALVEYFREEATIMIATEAAAEGLNLQFCSLIINYDLPWNPQRIEQRIGRCHRYGQKHDVVVVNFLNRSNAADERVFELLDQKFKLFSGVFGSSDEVIGALDCSVGFEKRIIEIYQRCREPREIEAAFDRIRDELDEKIAQSMKTTHQCLLAHFDSEVHDRLKVNFDESRMYLKRHRRRLLEISKFILGEAATFSDSQPAFELHSSPCDGVFPGFYRLGKEDDGAQVYRVGHPLARCVLEKASNLMLPCRHLIFNYTGCRENAVALEDLVGASGHLRLTKISVQGGSVEEQLVWSAKTDDGLVLEANQCERLFGICSCRIETSSRPPIDLGSLTNRETRKVLNRIIQRNECHMDNEDRKLSQWAEGEGHRRRIEIKKAADRIRKIRRKLEWAVGENDRLKISGELLLEEKKLSKVRRRHFDVQALTGQDQLRLIDAAKKRLELSYETEVLFSVRFSVI